MPDFVRYNELILIVNVSLFLVLTKVWLALSAVMIYGRLLAIKTFEQSAGDADE